VASSKPNPQPRSHMMALLGLRAGLEPSGFSRVRDTRGRYDQPCPKSPPGAKLRTRITHMPSGSAPRNKALKACWYPGHALSRLHHGLHRPRAERRSQNDTVSRAIPTPGTTPIKPAPTASAPASCDVRTGLVHD
jgi:hypothetical protein